MSKNKRIFLLVLLVTILSFSLSACWNKDNVDDGTDKEVVNLFETEAKNYTLSELKSEFSNMESIASSEFSGNYTFKPFYNVEQTTEFTFHFKSEVDPIKAITVHTDSKCEDNSLVFQFNDGYRTEDGVDVVVKPRGAMGIILNSEEREDYSKDAKWGYASVYYICVRYDLDATEPTKLEKPIIIPFTIRNEIDTPSARAKIDENGNLYVEWDKVENAVQYKIYSSIVNIDGHTREECGYLGDHLKLVETVDAETFKTFRFYKYTYDDENKDATSPEYNMYIDSEGFVRSQNNTTFNNLYITAIDANGNESQFSKAVSTRNYTDKIPERIEKTQFTGAYQDKFVDEVTVIMADDKTTRNYPVNFYKIKEPAEYLDYCEYRYEIVGTSLTGRISYKPAERVFPDEVISKSSVPVAFMPEPDVNINELPSINSSLFTDEEYNDAYIDLAAKIEYPEDAKIKYDPAILMIRTDIEGARMINGGIYSGEATLDAIDSYLASDDPEYILYRLDDGTIVVEKIKKTEEEENDKKKIEIEVKDPLAAKDKKVITASNYVSEQRKSTKKQVDAADAETVKGTNYPIFAENAEQKYLALKMVNHERKVSLKGFPALQNLEFLVDSLYYVYFQNPYVLDLDIENCSYSEKEQMLYLEYELDDATFEREKKEVYQKANSVIKEIIKPNMSDYEKVVAIWDYLETNTEYETEAFEYAKQHNFSMEGATGFENTFNVYGILCKGKGVCQSYAYTFKLLAHMCDIESIVVIGTMHNVNHAWNAIKIDGEWYMIDTTNNINAIAIPYWVFQTSSDFIEGVGYILSDEFVTGYDYSEYLNSDKGQDYYSLNGLAPITNKECGEKLAEQWHNRKNDKDVVAVKYNITSQLSYDSVMKAFVDAITTKYGHSTSELSGWVLGTTEGMVVVVNTNYYN